MLNRYGALLCALLPLTALGAADQALGRCVEIGRDADRLACFDRAMKRSKPVQTPQAPSPSTGKWVVTKHVDPISGKMIYRARLKADSGVGRYGDPIVMEARCASDQPDLPRLLIDWRTYLGRSPIEAEFRVAQDPPERTTLDLSTDGQATFFAGAISMLRAIEVEDSFAVRLTPYGSSPLTAVFDIRGAKAAFAENRAACGWEIPAKSG